jgi:pyridoxine kinase
MGRILAISSQVVRGHVGLSAMVPALQRLGHEVLAIPTIVLSNHSGHVRAAGTRMEVNTLVSILDVIDANGWLAGIDVVIAGYLPTPAHVAFAREAIERTRARSATAHVLVDPVSGDDPRGLYIDAQAADAIRRDLLPLADTITPNRFELSWLAGRDVVDAASAISAARALRVPHVIATSVPRGSGMLSNLSIAPDRTLAASVARRSRVPHGTGDLLTGIYIGHWLDRRDRADALGRAVAGVEAAIVASAEASDLVLASRDAAASWIDAPPASIEPLP